MSTPADGPAEKQELENVAEWLEKEGYRLEYLAHSAFQGTGLHAEMSYHVNTPEGKPREIDVMASDFSNHPSSGLTEVKVLCECKYSKEKPWVLLISDLKSDLSRDWRALPKSANTRIHGPDHLRVPLEQCWHFTPGHPLAHNLVQAFRKDNRDQAFNSLQKIANAAWDCAEAPARASAASTLHVVVIPCLIVQAKLLLARYDGDVKLFTVTEVPYGRFLWSGCRSGTLVDVVHVSALPSYARIVKETMKTVLAVVPSLVD
jgi:hypothetical protein